MKDIHTYLDNVSFNCEGYEETITVEHRSNNPKRDFLFVNKKQCKHIPCKPSEMLEMCEDLAGLVQKELDEEKRVLVIGFAETATAIGYAVGKALKNKRKYMMTTTRESISGSRELIRFEEEHSHATTQKLLIWENMDDRVIEESDYILFVEDEISTGNTILNFIKAFEKKFDKHFKFGVASICNWQDKENRDKFNEKGIDTFAIIQGELKSAEAKMGVAEGGLKPEIEIVDDLFGCEMGYSESNGEAFRRNRLGSDSLDEFKGYLEEIEAGTSVRVIGTEECMYPAIMIGKMLEEKGCKVICHATTRSKIDVISHDGITDRTHLHSAYDLERDTYLYNTDRSTDSVVVVTDSINETALKVFVRDIANMFGCRVNNIKVVRL